MGPLVRSASVLAGSLLLAAMLSPRSVSGQEKPPIGGEWADFACPMPVTGMPSTRNLREPPAAPRALSPTTNPEVQQHPTPVLSRRCYNPLASGVPLAMKLELTAPGGDRGWPRLFDPPARPGRDRFGLDDAIGRRIDASPPSLLVPRQRRLAPGP